MRPDGATSTAPASRPGSASTTSVSSFGLAILSLQDPDGINLELTARLG
ncbi:hypothetical protein ABIB25_004999 [Nakamurella sp. UYEF19]